MRHWVEMTHITDLDKHEVVLLGHPTISLLETQGNILALKDLVIRPAGWKDVPSGDLCKEHCMCEIVCTCVYMCV